MFCKIVKLVGESRNDLPSSSLASSISRSVRMSIVSSCRSFSINSKIGKSSKSVVSSSLVKVTLMFFPLRSFDDRQKDIFEVILTEWRRVTLVSIFYKRAKSLEKTGMINFAQATDASFENQALTSPRSTATGPSTRSLNSQNVSSIVCAMSTIPILGIS